jgi:hypothetical protein
MTNFAMHYTTTKLQSQHVIRILPSDSLSTVRYRVPALCLLLDDAILLCPLSEYVKTMNYEHYISPSLLLRLQSIIFSMTIVSKLRGV